MASERLFDEPTLRKLEQLTLIAHRVRVGVMRGERRDDVIAGRVEHVAVKA